MNRTKRLTMALLLAIGCSNASASLMPLVSYDFSWQGGLGYSLSGSFSYDAALAGPIIQVGNPSFSFPVPTNGAGPVPPLHSFSVSFFGPGSTPLQSFNTVANGISESVYFAFQFDTQAAEVIDQSYFNVGGGSISTGVQFFSGINGAGLTLFEHTQDFGNGNPRVLDSTGVGGDDFITIVRSDPPQSVPSPGTLPLTALAFGLLALRRGRDIAQK